MASPLASAFFRVEDDHFYIGNDPARGPWSADACHAGPVTGAIARSFEACVADKQLMKLSVEILRPVPIAGFRVEPEIIKSGRMVTTARATIKDQAGKLVATASSMHMQLQDLGPVPSVKDGLSSVEESEPGDFPIKFTRHGLPSFSTGIEILYPQGEDSEPGPTSLWMKALPIVEGEQPSPFQSLCPLADCGNGISRNGELDQISFINPDITIVMHRAPQDVWLGTRSRSHWQSSGMGLAEATLFDSQGPIASVMQTLLLQRVK